MHTMKKKEKFFGLLGISTIGILLSIGICINGYANSALAATQTKTTTTNAAIRVRSTCSMTATIDSGNEHTATMINGQYKEDIGLTTIQTFCNDPNGYAIYAIGYTGGDEGVAAGTNTVLHSNALGSTYDIITGTSTNGLDNDDTSNWSMKLTALGTTDTYRPDILNGYNNFSLVPQNYTKVASYNTATDLDNPASTRLGSNLTTTYAAYISNTQPAGTYEGAVKYILVHPGSIDHYPYLMQDVDEWGPSIAVGQEITVIDSRDNRSYTVGRMCMGKTLNAGEGNVGACSMEDSALWMTQNLDLCIGCSDTNALTSENTNITEYQKNGVNFADYTIDAFGIITWAPTASTMTGDPSTLTDQYTNQGFQILSKNTWNDYGPAMVESGDTYFVQGTRYNSIEACKNAGHTAAECAHYHVGNYYNWSAAVAMSDTSNYTTNYTIMPNSICPKGWRLPNGPTKDQDNNLVQSDFYKLLSAYNIVNEITTGTSETENVGWKNSSGFTDVGLSPFYFVRQGYVLGDQLRYYTSNAYYHSSTVGGGSNAYFLDYNQPSIRLAAKDNRIGGRAVRCVSDY